MAGGTRRIVFEVLFKQFSFDATLKKSSELPMPVNQRYPMGDRRKMGLRQLKTSHFREPEASRSTGEVGSRVTVYQQDGEVGLTLTKNGHWED